MPTEKADEKDKEKPCFVGWKVLSVDVILLIVGIFLLNQNDPSLLLLNDIGVVITGTTIAVIPIIILFGLLFGIPNKLPLATREQPEEPLTSGPSFKVYFNNYNNKKKLKGYLDGHTVFYRNHKSITGSFDDSDPNNIEFITPGGYVFERLINGTTYHAGDNSIMGKINNLKWVPPDSIPPEHRTIIYLKIRSDNLEGEIIFKHPNVVEQVYSIIEGDMRKMDDTRFLAILTCVFEISC